MKKVTDIGPIGHRVPLSSIEQGFLVQIKKDRNPLKLLETFLDDERISIKKIKITSLTERQKRCLRYLIKHFDDIVIDKPKDLASHISSITNSLFGRVVKNQFRPSDFGNALSAIFGYDDNFRSKVKKGVWLAGQLNFKSCPYCNAQYTLVVKKNTTGLKAKFQFDHFFSKKRYPYLSLSLYNLIPSCAQCNLSKSDTPTNLATHYHPYNMDLAAHTNFRINYPVSTKLSVGNISKLNISVKFQAISPTYKKIAAAHDQLYDIEPSYNRHTDIAEDLLYKAIVNNSSFKKDVLKIKGLFGSTALFERYLIGNYSRADEILDRPLAKFMQDIARQLKLIK